jgi:hypothetical protein
MKAMTRKWIYILPVALVLAVGCATTDTAINDDPYGTTVATSGGTEPMVEARNAPSPAEAPTHDPLGPPPRIESPIGQQYPSSIAGGTGNTTGSGTNTNLNPPPALVIERPSTVVVTETLIEPAPVPPPPAPVIAYVEPEPEPEPPIIETRVMVTKD